MSKERCPRCGRLPTECPKGVMQKLRRLGEKIERSQRYRTALAKERGPLGFRTGTPVD